MPDLPTQKAKMDKVVAIDDKQTDYADAGPHRVPGLSLRVTPSGKKTWAINARRPGRQYASRFTLGAPRDMTLTEARDAALKFKASLRDGTDPMAERTAKRAAATAARRDVIDDLIHAFAKHCETVNKTGAEQTSMLLNDVLPHWKGRNIKTIT
ncbi:MAG: DUF4102 domain-containing protein [Rhodospirillaceae bacterium]|nr:DUF4102 domain-containing protein [Rhodospirillaceae bacterium]